MRSTTRVFALLTAKSSVAHCARSLGSGSVYSPIRSLFAPSYVHYDANDVYLLESPGFEAAKVDAN